MAQVPVVDTRDPASLAKALRAIERLLDSHEKSLGVLSANKPLVALESVTLPPDNAPIPLGITLVSAANGSFSVLLTWRYTQGTIPATQVAVFMVKGTAPLAAPVPASVSFTVPASAQQAQIDGLSATENYRFGVAAAREGPGGFLLGPIQAPTANPDWADVVGGGAIAGLVNGVVRTVTGTAIVLTEETWVSLGTLTFTIPTWATATKVLLGGIVNLAVVTTTVGIYQILWRIRRGATVLFTAATMRYDSASSIASSQWRITVGPFMDQMALTGSVTYEVDFYKDDLSGSHAISASIGSQTNALWFSY